ncbi:MAG: U32 family peptidase [Robiginitomaculum sp.]|nr:MAG: U32 family peptidase [Robiginitomaculum sp.]
MQLTLGPLMFHWKPDMIQDFYARIADEAPIDRVVLGEVVCSKRLPFYEALIPGIAERLTRGGKEVVLASLGLVTLKRERAMLADLVEAGFAVEVNDLTMMRYLVPGQRFTVGPLVNVYNTGTLGWLIARGATHICLPPELPIETVEALAAHGTKTGAGIEVWAYGRLPLAISGRCYHARLAGRSKDSCQFVCEEDRDGLAVDTLDDQKFLAINGVQTLSESRANMVGDVTAIEQTGITSLRLSPHSEGMVHVAKTFRAACDGDISAGEALAMLDEQSDAPRYSNGFMFGKTGADWSHQISG